MATPDTPTTAAKARAWPRPILPEGNGRLMVRFMRESLRTSYTCSQMTMDLLTDGAVWLRSAVRDAGGHAIATMVLCCW